MGEGADLEVVSRVGIGREIRASEYDIIAEAGAVSVDMIAIWAARKIEFRIFTKRGKRVQCISYQYTSWI